MRDRAMNRRITIERATVTRDELGGEAIAWSTLASTWAAVEYISDGERARAGETAAAATNRFRIPRPPFAVTPRDRLVFEGRVFHISAVKEVGFRDGLELTAAARVDG